MRQPEEADRGVVSRPMIAVIVAQFLSAFGDNALLFVTLAVLKSQLWPEWSNSVMQMLFVAAYIILAPFVGQLADSFAKGRVMMLANLLKLAGALLICLGGNPFIGYSLVGIGAAAYSPAKYGILGEITRGEQLVKANGVMESSTIAAILLGSVMGGVLSDWNLTLALFICASAYGLAALSNCLIPRLPPALHSQNWHPVHMLKRFADISRELWRDSEARLSLAGTSLFWGAGVTLRFLLILWVPQMLGISDNKTPTLLNAMVAVGIVVGAIVADKLVTLKTIQRCMPAGILIGVIVILFSLQQNLIVSYALLLVTGVMGGFFIVPLNAMLQARGKQSVGAGNAVAVQNFGENSAMLIMLGIYSLAVWSHIPLLVLGLSFGGVVFLTMSGLWMWYRMIKRRGG